MKTLATLLSLTLACSAAFADVTETIEKSIPLSPKGSIELGNVNGSIEISAWDKNELSLVAEKRAKSDEDLQRIEVKIDETPDRITIETN